MENGKNDGQKDLPGKKELKKQLADQMETALPELREMLGEKKFMHRVKKAAKLLMEGLHKADVTKQKKQPATKTKKATKAATAKKAAAKKTTTKVAKAVAPKKVKSTKKANTGK